MWKISVFYKVDSLLDLIVTSVENPYQKCKHKEKWIISVILSENTIQCEFVNIELPRSQWKMFCRFQIPHYFYFRSDILFYWASRFLISDQSINPGNHWKCHPDLENDIFYLEMYLSACTWVLHVWLKWVSQWKWIKVKFKYLAERSLEMEAGVCFLFSNLKVWRIMQKMNTGKQIPRSAFLFILLVCARVHLHYLWISHYGCVV